MKTKLRELVSDLLIAAGPTLRRFWVSVSFTIGLTAALIVSTNAKYPYPMQTLNQLSWSFLAGVLTSWNAILFWELKKRSSKNLVVTKDLFALGTSAIMTGVTYIMLNDFTFTAISRHIGICILLFLLFLIIPGIRKFQGTEIYIIKLFSQAAISVLFTIVIFVGLSGITSTISYLFSLNIPWRFYLQLWLSLIGVLAPFLFMVEIPAPGAAVADQEYPQVLRNLVVYVIIPLLIAYIVILYLYFGKILITRQWPDGLVAHLVLWYSAISTATMFFLWPLSSENKWAEAFLSYFKKAVIPLLGMMFFSIGVRIKLYGITENRYYVVALGLWILGSMIYLNFAKTIKTIFLPISLVIVIAISIVSPFSSFAVAKWSQNKRLETLCIKYAMLKNNNLIQSDLVPQTDRREISEILQYFDRYHDLSDVKILPYEFTLSQFENVFGFPYAIATRPVDDMQTFQTDTPHQLFDIDGYQYLFDFTHTKHPSDNGISLVMDHIVVAFDENTYQIAISVDDDLVWQKDLHEFVDELLTQYTPQNGIVFDQQDMIIETEENGLKIKLILTDLWGNVDLETETTTIHYARFLVLLGK